MAHPVLPEEIKVDVILRKTAAAKSFQAGMWDRAAELFEGTYEFVTAQQRRFGRRFHKGWELHNWGIALMQVGETKKGIRNIYLAYIEDALSAELGREDEIASELAARVLADYGASAMLLELIRQAAFARKERSDVPADPLAILEDVQAQLSSDDAALESVDLTEEAVRVEKRRIEDGFEHPFERRCFVGGNYYGGGPNLEDIVRVVEANEFDPVVAARFETAEGDVHHRSLLLLHLCSKAVFEVTFPAGQLMELERCRDFGIKPLLLRNAIADDDPHVSAMISSMSGHEVKLYSTNEQLHQKVESYLTEGRTAS